MPPEIHTIKLSNSGHVVATTFDSFDSSATATFTNSVVIYASEVV